ncbi:VCBS repeat-containing protein [Streptosporangium sp. NBC_01755]|uniref:FG-GAP repeat domain-containing protein n=1 Tax=Streptosporangium sp. NBC_01755 TaxID=2975949 RepID=UPI002DDB5F12|nr:VCBS repeat-containing protein [Streptosporangium sp. NBC_01755]WSD01878.1 VCBS repeat-containing protein [Streptosporangium sp. NBC_01755]
MVHTILRRSVPATVAIVLCAALGFLTLRPSIATGEATRLAGRYSFESLDLNSAPPQARTERVVAPGLRDIRGWISAVGAAVALTDLRGLGHSGDVCLVDPRDDSVTLRPAPRSGGTPYPPVELRPSGGVPYDATMAPMGCVPADLDEDGDTDILVYYWGRSPVVFLNTRPGVPAAAGFTATELVEPMQVWNSTALNIADVDGDGHLDVLVGNYFPDGARVLDPTAADDSRMAMQHSMSLARNAGGNRILLGRPTGARDTLPRFTDVGTALDDDVARSWTLAFGLQDLTGDLLPEIYVANDFGPDFLLANESTPGHLRLRAVPGTRTLTMPKSKVLGHDSFKGMGVTFTYPGGTGLPMMMVSNITSEYALQESNFAFVPVGGPGELAFRDDSEELGLSRSGWAWDVKSGDFDNDGTDEILQATGFLKGEKDRWPELQELAMGNDDLLDLAGAWPNFGPGDDLSGHQHNPFWVRTPTGRYADLAPALGLDRPDVSRGFALGDVNGDGKLDAVVANQWENSRLLLNRSEGPPGIDLELVVPAAGGGTRAAVGAQVEITGPVRQKTQLYPANGHAGASASRVHLAAPTGSATGMVTWRDAAGTHSAPISLTAGRHTLLLGSDGTVATR